jgi:hypothetical protein
VQPLPVPWAAWELVASTAAGVRPTLRAIVDLVECNVRAMSVLPRTRVRMRM